MHIQIFYISPKSGWAYATYDENNNQVEESVHCFYKETAKSEAVAKAKSESISLVKSFGKSGQRLADLVIN